MTLGGGGHVAEEGGGESTEPPEHSNRSLPDVSEAKPKLASKSAIQKLREKRRQGEAVKEKEQQKSGEFVFMTPRMQASPRWRDENVVAGVKKQEELRMLTKRQQEFKMAAMRQENVKAVEVWKQEEM